MEARTIELDNGKTAEGYVVPLKGVNLVFAVNEQGMIGCGAFDVAVLNKFDCAAAKVGGADGGGVSTLDDLLGGIVKETNTSAETLGIALGTEGKQALTMLG